MSKTDSVRKYKIGHYIREARKSMGLRQCDLSALTHLPASHLSDIERGVLTPTIPTLHKISQGLNRPLEYFLREPKNGPRSLGLVIRRSSIGGQAAARLAQLVEEKTDGEMRLRIYQHAALGSARKQVRGLAEGAIHIFVSELWSFHLYAELCGLVDLAYFFRDRKHYRSFLQSSIFEEKIYQELLDHGIRLLSSASHWECGSFELLFSTEPLFRPADLVGRKFRSYASDAAVSLRRALGADPEVSEWERIYEAFEKGTVDTVLAPAAHFRSLGIHELAKYATYLSFGYTPNLTVAVSEREYRRFSPNVQRMLGEATEEAGAYCTELSREQSVADLEALNTRHGIPVIQPVQEDWQAAFTAAIRQICDEGLLARELYEELQSL